MVLLMLTIGNSHCLSTRFSQNALQTCKSLNKLISLLIFNTVKKKNHNGSIITQNSNKNENKIKLLDDPLKVRNYSSRFIFCSVSLYDHHIINKTWKLGGEVTETGRSGDQTWSSPVVFDNGTVQKRFLELVWKRSVLK